MSFLIELLHLSPFMGPHDSVNYDKVLFKIQLPRKIHVENSIGLRMILNSYINGGAKKIFVDMSVLEYIDSAGIGILINSTKIMRSQKGEIAFSGISPEIRKIFKVVNLQDFIKVFNLEAEAINYFRFL